MQIRATLDRKGPTECLYEEQYIHNPHSTRGPFRVHAPKHKFLYPSSTHTRKARSSMSYAAGLPTHHIVGQTQGGDVLWHNETELPHAFSIALPPLSLHMQGEVFNVLGNSVVQCTLMTCSCSGRLDPFQHLE